MTPFGLFLEKLRRSRQLRQKQLAIDLGINASYISALEKGHKEPPSKQILERLIITLDLSDHEQAELWESAEQSQRTIQLPNDMMPAEYRMINALRKQLGRLSEIQVAIIMNVLDLNTSKSNPSSMRKTHM